MERAVPNAQRAPEPPPSAPTFGTPTPLTSPAIPFSRPQHAGNPSIAALEAGCCVRFALRPCGRLWMASPTAAATGATPRCRFSTLLRWPCAWRCTGRTCSRCFPTRGCPRGTASREPWRQSRRLLRLPRCAAPTPAGSPTPTAQRTMRWLASSQSCGRARCAARAASTARLAPSTARCAASAWRAMITTAHGSTIAWASATSAPSWPSCSSTLQ
mmetsp:Transcript_28001/g.83009  ORF Transcript_28001/g.83009 Transcript_28001/m.83009 type:complete len:215 (-) Transcript_28001:448-1092(-)